MGSFTKIIIGLLRGISGVRILYYSVQIQMINLTYNSKVVRISLHITTF